MQQTTLTHAMNNASNLVFYAQSTNAKTMNNTKTYKEQQTYEDGTTQRDTMNNTKTYNEQYNDIPQRTTQRHTMIGQW